MAAQHKKTVVQPKGARKLTVYEVKEEREHFLNIAMRSVITAVLGESFEAAVRFAVAKVGRVAPANGVSDKTWRVDKAKINGAECGLVTIDMTVSTAVDACLWALCGVLYTQAGFRYPAMKHEASRLGFTYETGVQGREGMKPSGATPELIECIEDALGALDKNEVGEYPQGSYDFVDPEAAERIARGQGQTRAAVSLAFPWIIKKGNKRCVLRGGANIVQAVYARLDGAKLADGTVLNLEHGFEVLVGEQASAGGELQTIEAPDAMGTADEATGTEG